VDHARLAAELSTADDEARVLLLARHSKLVDARLARALKALYDAAESSDPPRAAGAAAALACLAGATDDPETRGLARWTAGMAALDAGRLEQAIADLAAARAEFMALRQPLQGAAVDVSSLIALAIVGRYDEALACGEAARDVFLAHADLLAAGKIEQNLGNIHWRRGAFPEAEQCYRAARERFLAAGDQKELARVHNNLANALSVQHLFRDAAATYEQALAYAQAAGLDVTQAEIECNVGCCALDQGHYDRALDYLERARRRYVALGMPRMAAGVDLELADTYLELNLAREAAAIYDRIAATRLPAALGIPASYQATFVERYRQRDLIKTFRLFDDVLSCLDRLTSSGLRVGVISNNDEAADRVRELNVEHRVEIIVSPATFGTGKPDPRIFAESLALMRVDPDRALYVGDSFDHDVVGARAAGLTPVLIDRFGINLRADDHLRVAGLHELADLIAGRASAG